MKKILNLRKILFLIAITLLLSNSFIKSYHGLYKNVVLSDAENAQNTYDNAIIRAALKKANRIARKETEKLNGKTGTYDENAQRFHNKKVFKKVFLDVLRKEHRKWYRRKNPGIANKNYSESIIDLIADNTFNHDIGAVQHSISLSRLIGYDAILSYVINMGHQPQSGALHYNSGKDNDWLIVGPESALAEIPIGDNLKAPASTFSRPDPREDRLSKDPFLFKPTQKFIDNII